MAGPALALLYMITICYFGLTLFLLFYTIVRMRTRKKSIPAGILFLAMSAFALNVYYERKQAEYKISRKFLGDYKLIYLDHKKCDNCKVRLKEDYTYDIFIKDKVVGHGKWQSETAIDIPGPFLEIENGPGSVIWEKDRLIEYINRTQN